MADPIQNFAKRTATRSPRERGSTLVEFSLVLLLELGVLLLLMDVAWIFFGWGCIQEAAREGVRYAITGKGQTESSLDSAIINNAVIPYSFGFINAQNASSVVSIDYYPSSGYSSSGSPASLDGQANSTGAGNIVKVTIHGISIGSFGPILRSAAPITLSASAADVIQ